MYFYQVYRKWWGSELQEIDSIKVYTKYCKSVWPYLPLMHEHDRWNRKLSPAQCNTSWIRWEDLQGSKLIGSDRWKMFSTVQLSLLCLSHNHIQSKHIDDTLELCILLYCWNSVLIIAGLMSSLGRLNWRKEKGRRGRMKKPWKKALRYHQH